MNYARMQQWFYLYKCSYNILEFCQRLSSDCKIICINIIIHLVRMHNSFFLRTLRMHFFRTINCCTRTDRRFFHPKLTKPIHFHQWWNVCEYFWLNIFGMVSKRKGWIYKGYSVGPPKHNQVLYLSSVHKIGN